ncbi:MAG: TRZ/ATZ family hydrolase [Granulosicoccaceae bacterium]
MNSSTENQSPTADCRIDAAWVLTADARNSVLENHSVISAGGTIVECLPYAAADQRYPDLPIIDRRSSIAMPGLVNAHTHLGMHYLKGLADDKPLMEWLENFIWPIEGKLLSSEFVAASARHGLAESIAGGVTCVNDMYFFPDTVAQTCIDCGLRAVVGAPIMQMATPWASSLDECFDRAIGVHDHFRDHPTISTAFAPHAPYTVPVSALEKIATLSAELEAHVHMHVHETEAEVLNYIKAEGVRPLARLFEVGLINPYMIAVHLTQLTGDEISLLAQNGSSAIHCPESNLKLASGFCPAASLAKAGVNTALGTDSAASNNDLDMFGEMKTAALLAKAVSGDASALPAIDAIRMATINGAKAIGLAEQTGSLEAGKQLDMICIEPDISMQPMYDVASHVVYCANRERVTDVWVAGNALLSEKRFTQLDVNEISQTASHWQQKISATT